MMLCHFSILCLDWSLASLGSMNGIGRTLTPIRATERVTSINIHAKNVPLISQKMTTSSEWTQS